MLVCKVGSVGLCASSHDLAHIAVEFTDGVVVAISVPIDHDKLQVLHLLEEVVASQACSEVGVERIHNLLSAPNLSPVAVVLLDDETAWI